jgi:RNA polymerase sigma-70 factor (ECF subfamily)
MSEDILSRADVALNAAAEHPPAFETFFQEHYEGVYGSLCLITRNRHEAEEIAQDAFMKMWERWDHVGGIDDPVAYVHAIAMNAFRRRTRRATMAVRRTLRMTPPDDDLAMVEQIELVVRLLAPLSSRQRAAIVLTDLLDYSSEEAARMLGLRPGAVRSLASRGRAALRQQRKVALDEPDEG